MEKFLEKLFDLTAEIILRTYSGIIIFFLLDGTLGFIYGEPFYISREIYSHLKSLAGQDIKLWTFIFVVFNILIWSWGKIIYILRQILLDKVKEDYLEIAGVKDKGNDKFKNDSVYEFYEKVRERVIEKLSEEFDFIRSQKENITDYLLYNILESRVIKGRTSQQTGVRSRSKDADEIAFLITNLLVISTLVFLVYSLIFFKKNGEIQSISCLKITAVALIIATIFYFLILSKKLIAKRYIARNLRLYINFLLEKEKSRESKRTEEELKGEGSSS